METIIKNKINQTLCTFDHALFINSYSIHFCVTIDFQEYKHRHAIKRMQVKKNTILTLCFLNETQSSQNVFLLLAGPLSQ